MRIAPGSHAVASSTLSYFDKKLRKLSNAPESQFKTSLLYGKEKMDKSWHNLIYETPYYYAAVILHPSRQITWFERGWRGYSTCIRDVKRGMKDFVGSYIKLLRSK